MFYFNHGHELFGSSDFVPYSENFGTIAVCQWIPNSFWWCMDKNWIYHSTITYITNQASYNRSGNGDTKFIAFNYSSATNYYIVGPFSLTGGTSYTSSVLYKADGSTVGPLITLRNCCNWCFSNKFDCNGVNKYNKYSFATISGSFTPAVTGSCHEYQMYS